VSKLKLVLDTNVLVSHLLIPGSIADQVAHRAMEQKQLLQSDATFTELSEVLVRRKFDRYLTMEERKRALQAFATAAAWIPIIRRIRACRDPRDDKFLELAINGSADAILTGDEDLLALHPFHTIAILTPAAWLQSNPE
jgi:uncharacterized protein